MGEIKKDFEALKEKLKFFEYTAYYNIFSQQALHEYFKYIKKEEYDLPGVVDYSGKHISLLDFCNWMDSIDKQALVNVKRRASTFVSRNVLKETFRHADEFFKNYKLSAMQNQNWYHFTRVVVNCLSHDEVLRGLGKSYKKYLPVTYGKFKIDVEDEGKPLSVKLEDITLIREIDKFVQAFEI